MRWLSENTATGGGDAGENSIEGRAAAQTGAGAGLMPFKSEKQRKYLWANEPKVAKKFAEHSKKPKTKKKATRKRKK